MDDQHPLDRPSENVIECDSRRAAVKETRAPFTRRARVRSDNPVEPSKGAAPAFEPVARKILDQIGEQGRAAAPVKEHDLGQRKASVHDGCLAKLAQGTVCKILNRQAVKAHKIRYYLERRDPEFEERVAEVLCVYREVAVFKETAAAQKEPGKPVAVVSYDEKPGIQAIATTAPDLPPKPVVYASFARDYEYKRHGTLSLLAGIDLLTGQVHALVKDRHRSREFIEFLKLLDAAYPTETAIKLILDNHSAHISKETKAWLARQPEGGFAFAFAFTFTAQARLLAQPD